MRPLISPSPSLLLSLLLLLLLLSPSVNAALRTPPSSFCKCTCGSNSTIIALNPPASSSSPASSTNPNHNVHFNLLARAPASHKLTCASCTRSFCASYDLPICKATAEDDIVTSCFQRDNLKDELVIYVFLAATLGLLGWAGIRPWVERVKELGKGKGQEEQRYTPARERDPEQEEEAENTGPRSGSTL